MNWNGSVLTACEQLVVIVFILFLILLFRILKYERLSSHIPGMPQTPLRKAYIGTSDRLSVDCNFYPEIGGGSALYV